MPELPEPWRTAQDYVDILGDDAEVELRRLARELMSEGDIDGVEKLFDVFCAIKALRKAATKDRRLLH